MKTLLKIKKRVSRFVSHILNKKAPRYLVLTGFLLSSIVSVQAVNVEPSQSLDQNDKPALLALADIESAKNYPAETLPENQNQLLLANGSALLAQNNSFSQPDNISEIIGNSKIISATSFGNYRQLSASKEIAEKNVVADITANTESNAITVAYKIVDIKNEVIVTAYSSTPDQTDSSPFITAMGSHVRDGIVACNFLPFGTKVRLPDVYGDKIFVVEDRMAKRNSYKVDVWMTSRAEALQFGVKRLTIEILE